MRLEDLVCPSGGLSDGLMAMKRSSPDFRRGPAKTAICIRGGPTFKATRFGTGGSFTVASPPEWRRGTDTFAWKRLTCGMWRARAKQKCTRAGPVLPAGGGALCSAVVSGIGSAEAGRPAGEGGRGPLDAGVSRVRSRGPV